MFVMKNLKETIIEHFDDQSGTIDSCRNIREFGHKTNHELLQSPYIFIEEFIKRNFKNENTYLDYCCGTGLYSIFPAKNGLKVFGMDISPNSIKIANEKANILDVKKLCNFEVMDAEELQYDDNFFDIIVSYNSLSYVNLNKSYSELNRVLKPKGTLIIMDSIGHNYFFNRNRNKNINKWASKYLNNINILKKNEIDLALKYFELKNIKYYELLSLISMFISKKIKLKIINNIDQFIMKLPFAYMLAFKYVAIYKSKKI